MPGVGPAECLPAGRTGPGQKSMGPAPVPAQQLEPAASQSRSRSVPTGFRGPISRVVTVRDIVTRLEVVVPPDVVVTVPADFGLPAGRPGPPGAASGMRSGRGRTSLVNRLGCPREHPCPLEQSSERSVVSSPSVSISSATIVFRKAFRPKSSSARPSA